MYYLKFVDLKSKQMTISLTTGIFNHKNWKPKSILLIFLQIHSFNFRTQRQN